MLWLNRNEAGFYGLQVLLGKRSNSGQCRVDAVGLWLRGQGDKEVSGTGVCVALQELGMARMRSEERERRICELLLSESCPQVPGRV